MMFVFFGLLRLAFMYFNFNFLLDFFRSLLQFRKMRGSGVKIASARGRGAGKGKPMPPASVIGKVAASVKKASGKKGAISISKEDLARVSKLEAAGMRIVGKICRKCRNVTKSLKDFRWALVALVKSDEGKLDQNEVFIVHLRELMGDSLIPFDAIADNGDKKVSISNYFFLCQTLCFRQAVVEILKSVLNVQFIEKRRFLENIEIFKTSKKYCKFCLLFMKGRKNSVLFCYWKMCKRKILNETFWKKLPNVHEF
jgi:hypothetical protein